MNAAVLDIATVEPSGSKAVRIPNFLRLLSQAEREMYDRIPAAIEHMPHPCFDLPDIKDTLFGQDWTIDLPKWRYYQAVEDELPSSALGKTVLSKEDEVSLFLHYNYARRQLGELIERLWAGHDRWVSGSKECSKSERICPKPTWPWS